MQSFSDALGTRPVDSLAEHDIDEWVRKCRYPNGAARAAIGSAKRVLYWAAKKGYIKSNPIAFAEMPPKGHREQLVERDYHVKMVQAAHPAFRPMLIALLHTGARPGELRAVTVGDYKPKRELLILDPKRHKTGSTTQKHRIIHVPPCAAHPGVAR